LSLLLFYWFSRVSSAVIVFRNQWVAAQIGGALRVLLSRKSQPVSNSNGHRRIEPGAQKILEKLPECRGSRLSHGQLHSGGS
jgi:hypothetical protein